MKSKNKLIRECKNFVSQNFIRKSKINKIEWNYLDNQNMSESTLLLIHGTRGNPYVFWNQFNMLKSEFRIISVKLPVCDNTKEICSTLYSLLNELSVNKVSILGTSIGGYFAQWFTFYYPKYVNKLFISSSIINGEGVNNPSQFFSQFILPTIPFYLVRKRFNQEVIKYKDYRELYNYIKEMIMPYLTSKELSKRSLALHKNRTVPELDFPDNDIIIIDCLDAPYIEKFAQLKVIEKYPKAKFIHLKSGHHFPYIIDPDTYNKIILNEIKSQ